MDGVRVPQAFVLFLIFLATLVAACQERSQIRRVSLTDAENLLDAEDLLLSSFQVLVPWQHQSGVFPSVEQHILWMFPAGRRALQLKSWVHGAHHRNCPWTSRKNVSGISPLHLLDPPARWGGKASHVSVADVDSRFMNVKVTKYLYLRLLNSWAGLGELVLHTNKIMNIFCFLECTYIYIYMFTTIIICNLNILSRFYFLVIWFVWSKIMGSSCSGSWAGARERQIRGSAGISGLSCCDR